jgi:hypothetical protein
VTIRSSKKKKFYELRVSYKHNNSSINYNDFSKNHKIIKTIKKFKNITKFSYIQNTRICH